MSIQEHTRFYKRQNRQITKFYAWVYNPHTKQNIRGPLRLKRAQAVRDEADILKQIEQGETFEKEKAEADKGLKFGQAYKLWLVPAKNMYADSTYRIYMYNYEHYIREIFDDRRVQTIKTLHIQKFVNYLSASKPEGKGYSPETVNKVINLMCNIFNFCVDVLKIIDKSPMDGIKRLTVTPPDIKIWTDEQQAAFMSADCVRKSHIYPMLCLSILGLRPGEVCGLAEADFHPAEGLITLHRGLNKYGVLTEMKTSQSHRPIDLYPQITAAIARHLEWKTSFRQVIPDFADNDFLFVSVQGNPINPDVYGKAFRKLQKHYNALADVPLPQITIYGLRHSFATINLLMLEQPANVVASIMGNSPKTLMTRYAHVLQQTTKKALDGYSAKILSPPAE